MNHVIIVLVCVAATTLEFLHYILWLVWLFVCHTFLSCLCWNSTHWCKFSSNSITDQYSSIASLVCEAVFNSKCTSCAVHDWYGRSQDFISTEAKGQRRLQVATGGVNGGKGSGRHMASAGGQAYNGDLGVQPPAGVQGGPPGGGRGQRSWSWKLLSIWALKGDSIFANFSVFFKFSSLDKCLYDRLGLHTLAAAWSSVYHYCIGLCHGFGCPVARWQSLISLTT